jgi:hypothetical protein
VFTFLIIHIYVLLLSAITKLHENKNALPAAAAARFKMWTFLDRVNSDIAKGSLVQVSKFSARI